MNARSSILIDRSASMAAGTAGASPFDKAQRQAGELIARLPDGSTVRLAYFDSEEVAPAPSAKIDPAIRPGLAGTDYTKALGWARDIVVASRRLKRQVFLLTDFQKMRARPASRRWFSARRGSRADRRGTSVDNKPGHRGCTWPNRPTSAKASP